MSGNSDLADALVGALVDNGVSVGDAEGLAASWLTSITEWLGTDAAIPPALASLLMSRVGQIGAWVAEIYDFWTGTPTGGPHGDGTYDLTLPDGTVVAVASLAKIRASMAKGDPAGIMLTFSTSTADADPGAGLIRFNSATLSSVTTLFVDLVDKYGGDITGWLAALTGSTATVRGLLFMQDIATSKQWTFAVTGATGVATGYRKVTVSPLAGAGVPPNGAVLAVQFLRSGEHGDSLLHGHGAPANAVGADNDVYLDLDTGDFYGPKAGGSWGSPVLATGLQTKVTAAAGSASAAAASAAAADASEGTATAAAGVATTKATATAADAVATAADRVQTGLDRAQTGADRSAVATDKALAAGSAATASSAATAAAGAQALAEAARDDAQAIAGFDVTDLATKTFAKRAARSAAFKYRR